MSYLEEITKYIDQDGLIGNKPNPEKWSNGNPILDTAIATIIPSKVFLYRFCCNSVGLCSSAPGVFNKNPGRTDQISHDDMIGAAVFYRQSVYQYAMLNGWVLSNTGEFYWDAWVKPWHRGYYCLLVGRPNLVYNLFLAGMLIVDGLFNTQDSSTKKLNWLIQTQLYGRVWIVDKAIAIWRKYTYKHWGSYKNIFKTYYGENHPFTRYVKEDLNEI